MAKKPVRPRGRKCRSSSCKATSLVLELTRALDSKFSRKLRSGLLGDHRLVVDFKIDPNQYKNADVFARDWLAVNLMKKYPKLNLGVNTEEVALDAFKAAEVQCLLTNKRLKGRYDTPTTGVSGDSLIETARRKISALLGPFSWNDAVPFFGFSGGATTRLRRTHGDAYYKFQGQPEVTREAALLACCAIEYCPEWSKSIREQFGLDPINWVKITAGSRITTVAKNAKTDRVIAVEPDMNMYIQRGLGKLIRGKLLHVGIDLRKQSRNQVLARVGSREDSLATIDLKAASDTISYALVERLLPSDWFEALNLVRCRTGTLPSGEVVEFQKFSSMGNGYTFELETLIFWALSRAVVDLLGDGRHPVAVYGDDIIVPKAAAGFLVELLSYVGFETNVDKTFCSGPFRESCGKHYFNGVDVTPFYISDEINSTIRMYWYLNSLRRWSANSSDGVVMDPRYNRVYIDGVNSIPRRERRFIPDGIGDCGLISTFTEATPKFIRGSDFKWKIRTLIETAGRPTHVDDRYAFIRALMYGCVGDHLTSLLVDVNRRKVKSRMRLISRWDDAPLLVDVS